jgi:hypothetical protein
MIPTRAQLLDIAERMVRTFIQAALAVIATDLVGVTSVDGLRTVLVAGAAAGLAAVLGLVTLNSNDDPTNVSVVRHR